MAGENKFGKTSKLHLKAGLREGRTVLEDVFFTAPYKVLEPFYGSDGEMEIMLLSASAGIMEGDCQEFYIHAGEGACLSFTSQSYEKIHKMYTGCARRKARLVVEPGAFLKYAPLPVIPFKASSYESSLEAELADDSAKLLYKEVIACGRAAMGEAFCYSRYHNLVTVKKKDRLVYRDNTRFEPSRLDMEGLGMYEGFTHLGSLVFFNIPKTGAWPDRVREYLDGFPSIEGGVTLTAGGDAAVRILGNQAQLLWDIMSTIEIM